MAADSLQQSPRAFRVTSIHRWPTPCDPPAPEGAGRGPNKQDGIQIEGVRKSVCGVKHKQARGPAQAGQLTLSDCGKCRLVLFFIRALSGALGFQRSVNAKARLQNENCVCASGVFFFFLRHLVCKCKVIGWFSLLSAICVQRCLVNFISASQAYAM